MRPKQTPKARHDDLFRARLDQIINMKHELVVLADKIDWTWLDGELADCFSSHGRPAEPVRFMLGMFLLKHTYALSDEQVWERWVQDPYFQYFTGEEFFQHELPHERSGMSHWRKRIGNKLDILLQETLRIAHDTGALKKSDLARVTIDTTVQPKNVAFPTDAKLLETAIRQLGKLAKKHDVPLRQSYGRVAKKAAMMAGRYAHAKQFKRMNKRIKFLRTRLGRLIRDITRKIDGDEGRQEVFAVPLAGPRRSAARSSASAAGSCIPGTRPRPSASEKAKRERLTSSASRCRSPPPTNAARAASSSCTPRPSPVIPTTATP